MRFQFLNDLHNFWTKHPALFYGLFFLLGVACYFSSFRLIWIPFVLLCTPYILPSSKKERIFYALLFFLAAFFLGKTFYQFPPIDKEGMDGKTIFSIHSISLKKSLLGKVWKYKGILVDFDSIDSQYKGKNIPCAISLPRWSPRPIANQSYFLYGKLKKQESGGYTFTIAKNHPWKPYRKDFSLVEWRYSLKKRVQEYIQSQISNKRSASFLAGMATGEFDDPFLTNAFSRFGLQHIMAISGFHFSILATILHFFLRLFCARKFASIFLIVALTMYFLFLGPSPSVLRAWVSITIALTAEFLEKNPIGLNSLGIALLIVLFFDPIIMANIGFQFSFIVTAAILVFYPLCDFFMQKWIIKRPLSMMVNMNIMDQHFYCLLTFLRQGLSLTLAVHLTALPMTLFYFQKFPVLSLVYNLFFPFMVSISLLFLMIGLLLDFSPLGIIFHAINGTYTNFLLNFTYNLPKTVDIWWQIKPFSAEILIGYLSFLFLIGIVLRERWQNTQEIFPEIAI